MEQDFFEFSHDGQNYKLPISLIKEYYNSDNFDALFFSSSADCGSLEKPILLQGLKAYGKTNRFYFPTHAKSITVYKNFGKICKYAICNAIKDIQVKFSPLSLYNVNAELINYLTEGTEQFPTKLEKAMYSYIKMCRTFTYDTNFFAKGQRNKDASKHKSSEHISEITTENNVLTCFEECIIFAKVLEALDINCTVNGIDSKKQTYHYSITANIGNINYYIDPLEHLFNDDFFRAKTCLNLVGFQSLCADSDKADKAQAKLKSVYLKYLDTATDKYSNCNYKDWKSNLDALELLCTVDQDEDTQQKIKIIHQYVNEIDLPKMEKLTYLDLAFTRFLKKEISSKKFASCIIVDNNKKQPVLATVTDTVNGRITDPSGMLFNQYNILDFDDNKAVEQTNQVFDRDTMQQKFDDGEYSYIYRQHEIDNHAKIRFESRLPYVFDYETPEDEPEM